MVCDADKELSRGLIGEEPMCPEERAHPLGNCWFSVDADRGRRMNIGSCSHTCYPACIWKEI